MGIRSYLEKRNIQAFLDREAQIQKRIDKEQKKKDQLKQSIIKYLLKNEQYLPLNNDDTSFDEKQLQELTYEETKQLLTELIEEMEKQWG